MGDEVQALIRAAFTQPGADWTASAIAEKVGISRTTAQRYLAHLARTGAIELHLRYGSTGRPEHLYRPGR